VTQLGTGLNVLVVEDNDEDFEALSRALRTFVPDIPLRRCGDGDEALDLLLRRGPHAAAERPSLVVLDLNLPGTDGREVLETIKTDPDLRHIPVVVLTTSAAAGDVRGAYRDGANCYLRKPSTPDQFRHAVDTLRVFWFETVILPAAAD
jgi:two-component system, chemotaxis family, response regulator Rcp1